MKTILFTSLALTSLLSVPAMAQTKSTKSVETLGVDAASGLTSSGLQYDLGTDDSSVSMSFSGERDRHTEDLFRQESFAIKATVPIDKDTKSGAFITNSGLSNAFSLKGSWSQVKGRMSKISVDQKTKVALRNKAKEICEKKKEIRVKDYIDLDCSTSNGTIYKWQSELTQEERDILTPPDLQKHALYYYGVSAEIGYREFKYFGPADLLKKDVDYIPYALSAFWGVSPDDDALYMGLGVNHKLEYEKSDTLTKCPTPTNTDPVECVTGAFSKPKKDKDSSVFALARYATGLGFNGSNPIAVEVRAAYDFEDKVFGVSVPVYLLTNKDGRLRGGVRFDWDDDDSDLGVGIFVGSTFDLNGSN